MIVTNQNYSLDAVVKV